ncbi:MAG: hypothetical protein LBF15_01025 [Candidatus Peribacteria bacterium]|nr:hypothetical protein [Candidatus Peribacteria bacterium]
MSETFDGNYDVSKLKEIINIENENIFLSPLRIELLNFIAREYFCPIHTALALFLPKNLREKIRK